jgi:hypothetical protein
VAAVTTTLAVLIAAHNASHRSTLTETVAAWSTFAAAAIALALGVLAETRLRKDRQAATTERERAQASQVASWVEMRRTGASEPDPDARGKLAHVVRAWLVVQNASSEPVWDVTVQFTELQAADDPGTPNVWEFGVIPPGAKREQEAPWTPPEQDEPLALCFRDNANRWWSRFADGRLAPLAKPPHSEE